MTEGRDPALDELTQRVWRYGPGPNPEQIRAVLGLLVERGYSIVKTADAAATTSEGQYQALEAEIGAALCCGAEGVARYGLCDDHKAAVRDVMPIVARELAARDAVIEQIRALHAEQRIYDECDCGHSDEAVLAGDAVDTGHFIACEETYLYSICQACCTDELGEQTSDCATNHAHARNLSICETARLLSSLPSTGETNNG